MNGGVHMYNHEKSPHLCKARPNSSIMSELTGGSLNFITMAAPAPEPAGTGTGTAADLHRSRGTKRDKQLSDGGSETDPAPEITTFAKPI